MSGRIHGDAGWEGGAHAAQQGGLGAEDGVHRVGKQAAAALGAGHRRDAIAHARGDIMLDSRARAGSAVAFGAAVQRSGHAPDGGRRHRRAMTTPAERKALLFFAALIVVGAGVRVVRAVGAEPVANADRLALGRQIDAVDAARDGTRSRSAARGKGSSASSRTRSTRSRSSSGGRSRPSLDAAERSAHSPARCSSTGCG